MTLSATNAEPRPLTTDVLVYGSTPGGIAAALEAARRGLRVVLACPKRHLGGMSASGLCTTDAVRRHLFGGIVTEFIRNVREEYVRTLGTGHPDWRLCQEGWHYEPSVAEKVFTEMVQREPNIQWLPGVRLDHVTVEHRRVQSATIVDGAGTRTRIDARTFIDATYEGDLAAAARVPYRVGREARDEHGEPLAGIHYMNWRTRTEIRTGISGEASIGIQAFCARCIVTDDPAHRIPITKPATYDQHLPDYLPLIDDWRTERVKHIRETFWGCEMPRCKREINGHIEAHTSINCPGVSWAYPEAGYRLRARLDQFHIDHAWGLLYFLQNDPHVPEDVARQARAWGLHDEEFVDDHH